MILGVLWVHSVGVLHSWGIRIGVGIGKLHGHLHKVLMLHFVIFLHIFVRVLVGWIWLVHRHHIWLIRVHIIHRIIHVRVGVFHIVFTWFWALDITNFSSINFQNWRQELFWWGMDQCAAMSINIISKLSNRNTLSWCSFPRSIQRRSPWIARLGHFDRRGFWALWQIIKVWRGWSIRSWQLRGSQEPLPE